MGHAGTARGGCRAAKHLMWYETKLETYLGKQEPRWTLNGISVATWGETTILAVIPASLGEDTWNRWHTKATPVSNDGYIPSPVPHGREWPVRGGAPMGCTAGPALAELEGGPRLLSPRRHRPEEVADAVNMKKKQVKAVIMPR